MSTVNKARVNLARNWNVVDLDGIPAPVGAYSPVVRVGDLMFVSGQVPTNADDEVVGEDIATQTRYVIQKLGTVLQAAGASLEDVVAMTVYLADIGDWPVFNEVYRAEMPRPYPTRTTVGAGLHGFLIEVTAIAAVPKV